MKNVTIIGGGLSGCEAAFQLCARGIKVELWEMRPERKTEAHATGDLAELVCSNSFKSTDSTRAQGLLKEELRFAGISPLGLKNRYLVIFAGDILRGGLPAPTRQGQDRRWWNRQVFL